MKKILFMLPLLFALACGEPPKTNSNSTPNKGLSINSTVPIPDTTKQLMVESLEQLFREVLAKGYTQKLSLSDYTIIVRNDCKPAPESGVMSWQQETPGYEGLIWQAERVEIIGGEIKTFQICNDVVPTMVNTTRYGAEHIILFYNDKNEFRRTQVHTEACNCPHPIIK